MYKSFSTSQVIHSKFENRHENVSFDIICFVLDSSLTHQNIVHMHCNTKYEKVEVNVNCTVPRISTLHYNDIIMGAMAPQITSFAIVCSTEYSGADQRKYQSSASLAFVRGIHRCPVNSPHKGPLTRKMFPFDDVIMGCFGLIESGACP